MENLMTSIVHELIKGYKQVCIEEFSHSGLFFLNCRGTQKYRDEEIFINCIVANRHKCMVKSPAE
jgi:hypothetical protein